MLNAEVSPSGLALAVGVDVKSVMRWINEDRMPYPMSRAKVAHVLGQPETFLWPSLVASAEASDRSLAELDRIWPTRSAISSEVWHSLFGRATERLDILVFAGGFLLESLDLVDVLRWRAASGTAVRILVGEPASEAVRLRSSEIDLPWLGDRCRTTLKYLSAVASRPGVSVRSHGSTLYASTFRFDDVVLVNTHAFGIWASQSPALQVRQSAESALFDFYASAFDRVWASAICPVLSPEAGGQETQVPGELRGELGRQRGDEREKAGGSSGAKASTAAAATIAVASAVSVPPAVRVAPDGGE